MLKLEKGSILLEALIAIAIFSFGLLALMGMQAMSIKNSIHAKIRGDASYLVNQIVSQVMVDQGNLATYDSGGGGSAALTAWVHEVQSALPNGTGTIAVNTATSAVTVTVTWRNPDETDAHQYVSTVRVKPAQE
ncbi:MAG: hypothetical protein Q8O34_01640 [Rhodocyclaceae bacterium]|nr:hypothetical protein [Rhodocyclaceae bacterium]